MNKFRISLFKFSIDLIIKSAPALLNSASYLRRFSRLEATCKCGGAIARLMNSCWGIILRAFITVFTSATVSPIYAIGGLETPKGFFESLDDNEIKLLVHRDYLDEQIPGILAGYLVYSGLLDDPVLARTVMEEILGRPLSPDAIVLIPGSS